MPATWTLVAHASGARLYAMRKGHAPRLLQKIDHAEGRGHASDLVSDRAGSAVSGGGAHTAYDPRTSPREAEAQRFARQLARVLDDGLDQQAWERLVIVAPRRFLGVLHARLSRPVVKRLAVSIGKDLAWLDDQHMATALVRLVPLD
ncbi:MAG: host attachment protein [Myxococcota bacterium]